MSLVEKLRKARESTVPIGGHRFTIRRPTELEMIELQHAGRAKGRAVLPFVIGWDDSVSSLALGLPGGDANPVAYDAAIAAEWLTDRLDLLQPLSDAVLEAYRAHEARQEDAKKN